MTSWQNVSDWYNDLVGSEGHYYHQKIILPGALKLLNIQPQDSLLDLACGQGVLARGINENSEYCGVDASPNLIEQARKLDTNPKHKYLVADLNKPLNLNKTFSHASIILALQNIKNPYSVIKNAALNLKAGGKFLIIINHPYFRIPKHTSWGFDEKNDIQYRRSDKYLSPIEIPISANPSKNEKSKLTFSYHYPLSTYSDILNETGFKIEKIEEWVSDKTSVGKRAKAENTSRKEFPLFMTILASKS